MNFEKPGKKALVLGGTGAMGVYLVPELLRLGYRVDVISLDRRQSEDPALRYIQADAMDDAYLRDVMKNGYDAVVDFMIYGTDAFRKRYPIFLDNVAHYIYGKTDLKRAQNVV